MADKKNMLYVPWVEKRKEIEDAFDNEEQTAKAWDRGEDLMFLYIMTIALM